MNSSKEIGQKYIAAPIVDCCRLTLPEQRMGKPRCWPYPDAQKEQLACPRIRIRTSHPGRRMLIDRPDRRVQKVLGEADTATAELLLSEHFERSLDGAGKSRAITHIIQLTR